MAHIAVERNRRKQMNENLKVLRSLTPCFYIKRDESRILYNDKGDQASIIGGVIEFIKELHQVLQALESKKQRKKSLSPSPSPKLLRLTPPQLDSPFANFEKNNSPPLGELGACCNSSVADVEAKLSGPNVILRTISKRIPGQVAKIVSILEKLSLEILHLSISSMEDTVLYSFLIKIGLECQLSVEELAQEVQQSFCNDASNALA